MVRLTRPITSAIVARLNAVGSWMPIAASDSELEYRFSEFADSAPTKMASKVIVPSQPGSRDA